MIKIERSFPAPASLKTESKKVSGSYSKPDVIKQLRQDFYDKCYICELKNLQDPQVEHLLPHKNGKFPERKLKALLRRESAFAAFKRNYIRDHSKEFPLLLSYIK